MESLLAGLRASQYRCVVDSKHAGSRAETAEERSLRLQEQVLKLGPAIPLWRPRHSMCHAVHTLLLLPVCRMLYMHRCTSIFIRRHLGYVGQKNPNTY